MHKSKDRKQTTNKPNTYSISQMNQKISLTSPIPSVKPIQNLIPINSCPTSNLPVVIIMLSYLWSMLMHRFYPWLFLVPWIGGRWYRITQLAVYTTYIPLIYCLLGGLYDTYHLLWGTRNNHWFYHPIFHLRQDITSPWTRRYGPSQHRWVRSALGGKADVCIYGGFQK